MHKTSYFNDEFEVTKRANEDGRSVCWVKHIKRDAVERVTVFKLAKWPNGWRNMGRLVGGVPGFVPAPESRGKKLSNSRLDLTLTSCAEHGHGCASC